VSEKVKKSPDVFQRLSAAVSKFKKNSRILEIWEIGSRDGYDSLALLEAFPLSRVTAFEPNPETIGLVEKAAIGTAGRMKVLNVALSDVDSQVVFYKIDTTRTITDWIDGNPGASSMFIANPDYKAEKYFQTEIAVTSRTGASLIETEGFPSPNLVWMDVQGAEELVLNGLGEHLSKIDFLYIELSLKRLYLEQPLASDIVKYLSKDFYWNSNLTYGHWQFDGFFVNKKYRSLSVMLRDKWLKFSLKNDLGIGIEYSFVDFFFKVTEKLTRLVSLKFFYLFRRNESKIVGTFLASTLIDILKFLKIQNISVVLRQSISMLQPSDPLKEGNLPTIDVAIPCHPKDFANLPAVIEGVRRNVRNPIDTIRLITPDDFVSQLQLKFADCYVLSDENVLGPSLTKEISELVPENRKGWISQQVIKFKTVLLSDCVATLIIDSDTILLTPKVWINSEGRQILCLSHEFHTPYKEHQRKVFGECDKYLSFVTHHQLMKRSAVTDIFGEDGNGLLEWLQLADYSQASSVSEYDTYGGYMVRTKPNEVCFSKWNNLAVKLENSSLEYEKVLHKFSSYCSISIHSHMEK
jgi:FkbM family methyltransferase